MRIEVCVNSIASIQEAVKGGAFRIELCDNLLEGGTTPSLGMIKQSLEYTDIKVFVIIRPRGGDFVYSPQEIQIMKQDIQCCGELGCDGVVFGVLTSDNTVDMEVNKELLNIAKAQQMDVTFHRAFDRLNDLDKGLEDVIALGFDRVLTSGGSADAIEGKEKIKSLIAQSHGRIRILPGGGLTKDNVKEFVQDLDIAEIHGTFKEQVVLDRNYKNKAFDSDYVTSQTIANNVSQALQNMK